MHFTSGCSKKGSNRLLGTDKGIFVFMAQDVSTHSTGTGRPGIHRIPPGTGYRQEALATIGRPSAQGLVRFRHCRIDHPAGCYRGRMISRRFGSLPESDLPIESCRPIHAQTMRKQRPQRIGLLPGRPVGRLRIVRRNSWWDVDRVSCLSSRWRTGMGQAAAYRNIGASHISRYSSHTHNQLLGVKGDDMAAKYICAWKLLHLKPSADCCDCGREID
ncbi:hypothetical protein EBS_1608 [endosymbiont of unidentified scaly snail isolate Monju]|nr:hypothetical protein EBS_1608 [endosymbiont of unidentified scaly snail isolate Monju]